MVPNPSDIIAIQLSCHPVWLKMPSASLFLGPLSLISPQFSTWTSPVAMADGVPQGFGPSIFFEVKPWLSQSNSASVIFCHSYERIESHKECTLFFGLIIAFKNIMALDPLRPFETFAPLQPGNPTLAQKL